MPMYCSPHDIWENRGHNFHIVGSDDIVLYIIIIFIDSYFLHRKDENIAHLQTKNLSYDKFVLLYQCLNFTL